MMVQEDPNPIGFEKTKAWSGRSKSRL